MQNAPSGKSVTVFTIPGGATSFIQPLDAFFFRVMKAFDKRITNYVLINDIDFPLARRNNILKVIIIKLEIIDPLI